MLFIAIPAMESVNTMFFQSILGLKFGEETPKYGVSRSSLIYDARNALAQTAVESGAERVLWLDSDMVFDSDIATRLLSDMDEGRELVSALYFKRKNPIAPVIYTKTGYHESQGKLIPYADTYADYPRDSIFEVAAVGFGACMMTTDLLVRIYDRYGAPFSPVPGFGEDLSFCRRCEEMGVKMYVDSRIRCGHVGETIVTEQSYINGLIL